MPLSSLLYTMPYRFLWRFHKARKRLIPLVAYCAEPLDYLILEPVIRHLEKPCVFVAKNGHTVQFLKSKGIFPRRMPVFPETVLMARHSAWKFPVKEIRLYGFRHGPYYFKTFTHKRNYHAFTRFFLTSAAEEKTAREKGIERVKAVGYPKLDPAFDGIWTDEKLGQFRKERFPNPKKPILLFSATWEKSGMSAVRRWYHRLNELTTDYTVCVTLHPWVSKDVTEFIHNTPEVFLLSMDDILPVMMLADLTVSDTSSIIGEFIALEKRIVTFRTGDAPRKPKDLDEILDKAGYRVDTFDELKRTVGVYLNSEDTFVQSRRELREMMFCNLGSAGKKAAEIINNKF